MNLCKYGENCWNPKLKDIHLVWSFKCIHAHMYTQEVYCVHTCSSKQMLNYQQSTTLFSWDFFSSLSRFILNPEIPLFKKYFFLKNGQLCQPIISFLSVIPKCWLQRNEKSSYSVSGLGLEKYIDLSLTARAALCPFVNFVGIKKLHRWDYN